MRGGELYELGADAVVRALRARTAWPMALPMASAEPAPDSGLAGAGASPLAGSCIAPAPVTNAAKL